MAGLVIDKALPGLISAKTHGVIDYIHAGTNFVAAIVFRNRDRRASNAALALGAGVLVNAMMTDYPLGVFRKYNFKVHGALDYGLAAAAAAIPAWLGVEDSAAARYSIYRGPGSSESRESLITAMTRAPSGEEGRS